MVVTSRYKAKEYPWRHLLSPGNGDAGKATIPSGPCKAIYGMVGLPTTGSNAELASLFPDAVGRDALERVELSPGVPSFDCA
jgi:hypothetical protein